MSSLAERNTAALCQAIDALGRRCDLQHDRIRHLEQQVVWLTAQVTDLTTALGLLRAQCAGPGPTER